MDLGSKHDRCMGYAAAVVRSDVRAMTKGERASWQAWQSDFAARGDAAGPPPQILALGGEMTATTEHAAGAGDGTLCGIPEADIDRHRHLFDLDGPRACRACAISAAPSDSA